MTSTLIDTYHSLSMKSLLEAILRRIVRVDTLQHLARSTLLKHK